MGFLKVDFIDDEILYAGATSSISSMNGITYTINQKLLYAGNDTEGSIANSTTETTVANFTIPANTFSTRCVVWASTFMTTGAADTGTIFKIKIGAAASETLKQTKNIVNTAATGFSAGQGLGDSLLFMDTAEDYTSELSVIITAQNSATAATHIGYCKHLVVAGV